MLKLLTIKNKYYENEIPGASFYYKGNIWP